MHWGTVEDGPKYISLWNKDYLYEEKLASAEKISRRRKLWLNNYQQFVSDNDLSPPD